MESTSVLIDGRLIPISELRSFYHSYTAIADPTEAEARRRCMLLSIEHTGNAIIHEITRPLGSTPDYQTRDAKQRYILQIHRLTFTMEARRAWYRHQSHESCKL